MSAQWNLMPLESLGALRVRGRDTIAFLQGQLSADVTKLAGGRSLLAGYHNPQGRVLALLWLIGLALEEVLAILPRELVAPVASRLSGFILRSKVALADDSAAWRFDGLVAPDRAAGTPATGLTPPFVAGLPQAAGGIARLGDSSALRLGAGPARWLLATPSGLAPGGLGLEGCQRAAPELWRRLAIESGEPQIYAATSGEFVAQMLNLDALGAIDFDKGCYTGQEIIARAHYRGRVKRRLQRFRTAEPVPLQPGAAGELADGRAFTVVDAVPVSEGGCEFLAVAPLADGGPPEAAAPAPTALRAAQLPLPYALPD